MLWEYNSEVINFTWWKVWMGMGISEGILERSLFF